MVNKTAYQLFHDEQMKATRNKSDKSHNQLQKEIGQRWERMTQKDKQPYFDKKKEYDEQLLREQQVLKKFQKQGLMKSANEVGASGSANSQPKAQTTLTNLKFVKSDLQKQELNVSKAVVVSQKTKQTTQPENKGDKVKVESSHAAESQQAAQSLSVSLKDNAGKEKRSEGPQGNHKAYLEFFRGQFQKYKKQFPKRDNNELTQMISREWTLMKLSHKLREKENKSQIKKDKKFGLTLSKGKLQIEGKEVDVPKKPLSGYLRFYKKNYDVIKAENPETGPNEIARLASEKWNLMADEQKKEFNTPFIQEMSVFQRQRQEFISKHGFFPSSSQGKAVKNTSKSNENKPNVEQKVQAQQHKSAPQTQKKPVPQKASKNTIFVNGVYVQYPVKLSGYYLFEKTLREKLAEKQHNMDSRTMSAFIGEQWKNFPAESRAEYEAQQEREYKKRRVEFISKYGNILPPLPEPKKKKAVEPREASQNKSENPKNLNIKRKSENIVQEVQQKKKIKLSEEEIQKKIDRKQRINYDDVESEAEDLLSCIEQSDNEVEDRFKTDKEEDFETFERKYKLQNNKKEVKVNNEDSNQIEASASKKKKQIVPQKSLNPLFELLNQPIDIPDFTFGPNF